MDVVIPSKFRWRFKEAHHIIIATDRTIYNLKTGRCLKEVVRGGYTHGFNIVNTFVKTSDVRGKVEPIPDIDIPF